MSLRHLFPSPRSPGLESSEASAWSPEVFKEYDSVWPLPSEAGILLNQYHDIYGSLFPFVVMPPHMTAAELKQQKPFLWKAVMMTSCFFDASRQLRLGHELLNDVMKASFMEGVQSLDLLQALLLMISWFNVALKGTQLTHLLFLARSMSMSLNSPGCHTSQEAVKFGTLEHIRAYAGAYYLNTLVFTTNKKTDALMSTSQLDTYCQVLEAAMEYSSDEYLIKLVRIQQLTQSIALTMAFDPNQPTMQLHLTMVVQSFQQQIDRFRQSLPPHLQDNPTLLNHMGIAEVLVMDVAISDQHCNPSIMPLSDRLQLLWACVRSLRSFFNVRVGGRCFEKPRFIVLSASDLAFAIITAMKLLMVKVPGWNPKIIVSELALYELLESHIQELNDLVARRRGGLLSMTEGGSPPEDPMERLCRLLKNGKELIDLQLQKRDQAEVLGDASQGWMMGDLDEEMWANFVSDTAWNVTGDPLLMDMN
ncbi:hypothetical protein PT974_08344 [Cladobotryum mycophilum]|uniref:Cercosporin resistance protein n=1 Tax=Cladobotryum mycophilum TaxID=491253 RepID=A0ABR0SE91_9HYPO